MKTPQSNIAKIYQYLKEHSISYEHSDGNIYLTYRHPYYIKLTQLNEYEFAVSVAISITADCKYSKQEV